MTPSEEKALISSSSSSWGRGFCCLSRCSNGLLTAGVRVLSGNRRKEMKVFCIKKCKSLSPLWAQEFGQILPIVFRKKKKVFYSVSENCCFFFVHACMCVFVVSVCGEGGCVGRGRWRRYSHIHPYKACRENEKLLHISAVKKPWGDLSWRVGASHWLSW